MDKQYDEMIWLKYNNRFVNMTVSLNQFSTISKILWNIFAVNVFPFSLEVDGKNDNFVINWKRQISDDMSFAFKFQCHKTTALINLCAIIIVHTFYLVILWP